MRKVRLQKEPVEQGVLGNNNSQQANVEEENRGEILGAMTEQALTRITQEFGKALDRSNDIGEVKGRLAAVEQQVRHQENRTDARFDKTEAKMDAGFSKMENALAELTKVVVNINRKMATNEGERKGIVSTAIIISTLVGGAFAFVQFCITLWFK